MKFPVLFSFFFFFFARGGVKRHSTMNVCMHHDQWLGWLANQPTTFTWCEKVLFLSVYSELDMNTLSKGQTTLSTKSRRFRAKRRSKVSFDHTRLRFHINRLATVRQSKKRTNVENRSRAAQLENDDTPKTCLSTPPPLGVSWCTLCYHFHESCLDDFHDTVRKRGFILSVVWP